MTHLRVGTYNVHKCKGTDWRVSAHRVADVICELQTDILAVQEILHPQAETISERAGLPFFFGQARLHDSEPYGNAIFTRLPVSSSEIYDLSVGGREPRACIRASVKLPESTPLHFFGVHLGTSFLERRKQARRIIEVLNGADLRGCRIVAGDFNEWTRGLATEMLSRCMQSADIVAHLRRTRTYPGLFPFLHLDHIYYDDGFHLRCMHLHNTRLALLASDHLPLLADFAISVNEHHRQDREQQGRGHHDDAPFEKAPESDLKAFAANCNQPENSRQ